MQFKIRHVQTCRWHGLVGRKRSVGEALDAQKNQRKNATFSSSGSKQIQLCMAIQSSAISFIASFFNQFAPRLSVQCHLYCGYKMLVLCLQGFCSVATRCLQRGYKMLAVWLQSFCSVAARCLQCGNKAFVVWQQCVCSVATNMVVVNHQPVVVLQDGSKSQKGASLSYCLFLAFQKNYHQLCLCKTGCHHS